MDPLIFILLLVFAVMAVIGVFAVLLLDGGKRQAARRVKELSAQWQEVGATVASTGAPTLLKSQRDSSLPFLDALIKRVLPRRDMLRRRLERTGLRISTGQYLGGCVAAGLAGGLFAAKGLNMAPAVVLLMALAAAFGLPHAVVGILASRRQKKFTDQFPEAIDLIVRGLRSGLPVIESIIAVGREMQKPAGTEFRAIADAVRFGKTLEDAMWDAVPRIDTPEFKFFVVALSVQRETGGNLAETLENLSDVLRKRRQMKMRIKAMASEPKASAWILGSLPFIMFAIIFAVNTEYVMTLFTDPRGPTLIGFGLLSQFIGVAIMAKMVRFEI